MFASHFPVSDTPHGSLLFWPAGFGRVGGYSGGETPGPIPNPEAKPAYADGTALGRVWESKSPPTPQLKNEIGSVRHRSNSMRGAPFCVCTPFTSDHSGYSGGFSAGAKWQMEKGRSRAIPVPSRALSATHKGESHLREFHGLQPLHGLAQRLLLTAEGEAHQALPRFLVRAEDLDGDGGHAGLLR